MAGVRFRTANSILRNLTKVNVNNNVRFMLHRENHMLAGCVIQIVRQTSPILIKGDSMPFHISYRLEHAVKSEEVVGEKVVATQTEIPKSNITEKVVETQTDTPKPSITEKVESNSSDAVNSSFDSSLLPEIPETPGVSSFIEEPTLKSLGLGGWSPSGIVQHVLEFFHSTYDLPWWACIVSFTFVIKICLFPLSIKSRRHMINLQNNMPQFQKLQSEMSQARKSGNYFEAARTSQEFSKFLQEKKITPGRMFITSVFQAPVFISVYFALRKMASVPEFTSFQTGGILWFTDLSVPDQFYILPLCTSLTLWATLKYNISMRAAIPSQLQGFSQTSIVKIIEIGVPIIVFIFSMNFPSAVLCYWTTSNFFMLCQTYILSFKPVKEYFRIPNQIPLPNSEEFANIKKLGIIDGFKESYTNLKITKEIEQRELLNAIKFEEIGNKPAKRTFKFDPTKAAKLANRKK